MENTLENKARFFAQYWGQKTLIPNYEDFIFPHTVNEQILDILYAQDIIKYSFLELKPLSSITDEDKIGLGCVLGYKKSVIDNVNDYLKEHEFGDSIEQPELDFLRSKGYALPYMRLSVEELESFGWIKLKSE